MKPMLSFATTLDKPHESFLDTLEEDRFMQLVCLNRGINVAYNDNINPWDNLGSNKRQLRKTLKAKRTKI